MATMKELEKELEDAGKELKILSQAALDKDVVIERLEKELREAKDNIITLQEKLLEKHIPSTATGKEKEENLRLNFKECFNIKDEEMTEEFKRFLAAAGEVTTPNGVSFCNGLKDINDGTVKNGIELNLFMNKYISFYNKQDEYNVLLEKRKLFMKGGK